MYFYETESTFFPLATFSKQQYCNTLAFWKHACPYFVWNLHFCVIGKVEFLRRLQSKRNKETKCQNAETKGSEYIGYQNMTQSGLPCQQWRNAKFGNSEKHRNLPKNYCRWPYGQTSSGTLTARPESGATLGTARTNGVISMDRDYLTPVWL